MWWHGEPIAVDNVEFYEAGSQPLRDHQVEIKFKIGEKPADVSVDFVRATIENLKNN
jgi:hypothetical protein